MLQPSMHGPCRASISGSLPRIHDLENNSALFVVAGTRSSQLGAVAAAGNAVRHGGVLNGQDVKRCLQPKRLQPAPVHDILVDTSHFYASVAAAAEFGCLVAPGSIEVAHILPQLASSLRGSPQKACISGSCCREHDHRHGFDVSMNYLTIIIIPCCPRIQLVAVTVLACRHGHPTIDPMTHHRSSQLTPAGAWMLRLDPHVSIY